MLTPIARQKAVDYVKQHARPLEKALYTYYFESGTTEDVLHALSALQNDDGGFGHGLEADIRLSDSSVIATTVAFQKFRELHVPSSHPIVQKAIRYLLNTYDATHKVWRNIPPHIDDAPHAPWWDYDPTPEKYLVNPRAEILGYIYDYADSFPAPLRDDLSQAVMTHIQSHTDVEMHDLLCYIRLLETATLPTTIYDDLLNFLTPVVEQAVNRNPIAWGEYGLTPLSVVTSPQSPFYASFADIIPQNLDHITHYQADEGYWSPSWSWEFASASGWHDAERDWRGVITLGNLLLDRLFS